MATIQQHTHCTIERQGHLTVVTLNRPEVLNALHYEADVELDRVFNEFESDADQWVAIVTGAGNRAFCAGNDLKAQAARGPRMYTPSGFGGLAMRLDLDKPVIAAVNGIAMGGGFELALSCDVIVAARNAVFALPEPQVGLAPIAGGVQYLPRAVGMPRAMGMLLTGRRVDAQEALAMGLVTAVADEAGALAAAMQWAEQMLECSPMALRAIKQAARRTLFDPAFEERMRRVRELPAMAALRASHDFVEGPRAFTEKRKPDWKNR
jgi:enoyl-CoA hydratase/carnithine racemase